MKKMIVGIIVFLLMATVAFAPPEVAQFKEVWISNATTSDHTAGMYRVGDDYTFIDPNAGALKLTELMTGVEAQIVTVAKSGGEFTTIQAAIDSITDSSAAKPYVVLVYPGVYEEQVTLDESYVSIVGIQPNGAAITEAQNSGVIITYESSGVGDDLMTLWLKGPTVTTDLLGVTLANLTIINTQVQGEGAAQMALDIGRTDTYPRAHEILVKN